MIRGLIVLTDNSPFLPVGIALVCAVLLWFFLSEDEVING